MRRVEIEKQVVAQSAKLLADMAKIHSKITMTLLDQCIMLETENDEQSMRMQLPCAVAGEGTITLSIQQLRSLWSTESISIQIDRAGAEIQTSGILSNLPVEESTPIEWTPDIGFTRCNGKMWDRVIKNAMMSMATDDNRPLLKCMHLQYKGAEIQVAATNSVMGYLAGWTYMMQAPHDGIFALPRSGIETWKAALQSRSLQHWSIVITAECTVVQGQGRTILTQVEMKHRQKPGDMFKLLGKHSKQFSVTAEMGRKQLLAALRQCKLVGVSTVQVKMNSDTACITGENAGIQFRQEIPAMRGGRKTTVEMLLDRHMLTQIVGKLTTPEIVLGYSPEKSQSPVCFWSGKNHTEDMFLLMPIQERDY